MMGRFIIARLGGAVILLIILTSTIFALQSAAPGDPVTAYLGANASRAAVAAERKALGLNQPFFERYTRFVGHALQGNLGISYRTHDPVSQDLHTFLPATIELVIVAFVFAIFLGSLFAVSGALKWPGTGLFRGGLLLLACAPAFFLAIGGVVLFFSKLHLLPLAGQGPDDPGPTRLLLIDTILHGDIQAFWSAFEHLIIPAAVLSFVPAVSIGRVLRSGLDQSLNADYVRTAESKGLSAFYVLRKHVLRNSIGPALSMAGLQLGFMFGGAVVVEQVVSWPGIGNYLALSIQTADYPAIMGVTLVLAAVYVVANMIVDILQVIADPRLAL